MKRFLLAVASISLLSMTLVPSARADVWNKKTIMTVNQAIQVPHKVLPAGTYVIKLLDSASNRHIVQIFNEDETEILTTVLAIPNYRLDPTGHSVFTFWEMPPGQPPALRAWFYPGDNFGQEFAYPKTEAVTIAGIAHAQVPTTEAQLPAEMESAPVAEVTEEGKEEPIAQAPPAPLPEVAKEIPPPPMPELPKTASPNPLIGLIGLLSLLTYGVLRVVRNS